MTPIIVRQKARGKYRLMAGEHRLAAFKSLGMKTIRAEVRPVDDSNSASISDGFAEIDENLARNDLSEGEKKLFAKRWRMLRLAELKQQKGLSSKSAEGEATRALAEFLGLAERTARWRVQEADEIEQVAEWAGVDARDIARSSIQSKDQLKVAATIIDKYGVDVAVGAGNVHQLLRKHVRLAAKGNPINVIEFKAAVDKELRRKELSAKRSKDEVERTRHLISALSKAAKAVSDLEELARGYAKEVKETGRQEKERRKADRYKVIAEELARQASMLRTQVGE